MMLHRRARKPRWFSGTILTFFCLVAMIPFAWVIANSFKGTAEIFTGLNFLPKVPHPENYPQAWKIAKLGLRFYNSIFVTILTAGLALTVTAFAGYSFAKLWLSRHPAIFYTFLLGMAIPSQAIVLSIFLQIKAIGLQNTRIGLVLALVGTGVPFATFLMRSFFRDLPDSFGECSRLDGCNTLQTFLRVYLPLARPGLMALAIFLLIGAWNEFEISLVVLTDDLMWTISLGVARFKGLETSNYGYVFSSAVISFLPVVLVYCLFQKSFIAGITVGGVKG